MFVLLVVLLLSFRFQFREIMNSVSEPEGVGESGNRTESRPDRVQNSNLDVSQGYNDPYFLSTGDNLNAPLTNYVFHGSNFVNWSRSAKNALIEKNVT